MTIELADRETPAVASEPSETRWLKRIAFLQVLACFAILFAAYRVNHPFLQRYFIADMLYLPTLFSDLASGGSLSHWYLPPAPYFFPDFLEYLAALAVGHGTTAHAAMFSAVQLLLLFGATVYLARNLGLSTAHRLLAGAGVVVTIAWFALRDDDFRGPAFALISAIHFGTFLSTLLLAALWLGGNSARSMPRRLLLIGALSAVATLSDLIFVVQAVVPFVVTTALVRLDTRGRRIGLAILAVVVGAAAGRFSYGWIVANDTRPDSSFSTSHLGERIPAVVRELWSMVTTDLLVAATIVSYLIACGWVLFHRSSTDRRTVWLVTYSALSMVLAPVVLTTMPGLAVTSRYVIPAVGWPIVMVIVLVLSRESLSGSASLVALASIALASMSMSVIAANAVNAAYPADVACIDRAVSAAHARYGIAGYWDAKPIQNQSKRDLVIAQYTNDLQPRRWLTTDRYFRPAYDFAIVTKNDDGDGFSASTLLGHAPHPHRVVDCGPRQVFLYGINGLVMS